MRATRTATARVAALGGKAGKENLSDDVELESTKPMGKGAQSKKGMDKNADTGSQSASAQSTIRAKSVRSKPAPARKPTTMTSKSATVQDVIHGGPGDKESTPNETEHAKAMNESETIMQLEQQELPTKSTAKSKKRKRTAAPKLEADSDELPHGLGKPLQAKEGEKATVNATSSAPATNGQGDMDVAVKAEEPLNGSPVPTPSTKRRARGRTADKTAQSPAIIPDVKEEPATKKPPKKKANPYGLTPGVSPYPDWPHPTPQECQDVHDLLSSIHGKVSPPKSIPPPSETVAGCGEVPCVLDAVIRTYLSSATSGKNSSRAFQGLIDEYGKQTSGMGKGSVNWDAVRRSPVERVFNAIKSGGLAAMKSKNIKKILDMVYEENQARRAAFLAASAEPKTDNDEGLLPAGASAEGPPGRAAEIARADNDVLSLDHLHALPDASVFTTLLAYPGIGVKTTSCVLMFCLRRPSFAVDTHVFRLCSWLGWVPPTADRDKTFMHCEVRVPDGLKYALHQLLIQHGKKCPRCRAITGESSEGWGEGCVIDHLVRRTGERKGGEGKAVVKGKGGKKRKKVESDEEEEESAGDESDGDESEPVPKKTTTRNRKTPARTSKRVLAASKKGPSEDDNNNTNDDESAGDEPIPSKKTKTTKKKTAR
ncbi:MAG: hypothetical protein LQ344_003472 [Seirophora lacunosa]|nr:MAG: hypothetical protein LQ344_003472 [Seirophora lacunosa]